MARLGADTVALGELGASMRLAARTLDTIAGDLDRRVRSAGWSGRDADRFLGRWSVAHRVELRACADRLGRLGADLRTQAEQQRAASAAAGPTVAPGSARPHRRPLARSTLAPLPRAEVRYVGGIDLKLGLLSVALSGSLAIQELPGNRSRVVWSESVGAGATAGAGAAADLSISDEAFSAAPTAGLSADATVRVGPTTQRSWDVDRDQVDDLLLSLALEQAARAGTVPVGALSAAGGVIDGVIERFSGYDPDLDGQLGSLAELPPADRTEQLLDVAMSGGVGAGLAGALGVGGRVGSTGSLRAGIASAGRGSGVRRHLVVDTSGATAAAVSSTLLRRLGVELPGSARTVTSVRLELPVGEGHSPDAPVTVHLSAGDGREMTDVRAAISGAAAPSNTELASSVRALASGDLDGALSGLAAVDLSDMSVEVAVSGATVDGTSVRGGAAISAGLRAGAGARGQMLEIRRSDAGT